MMKLSIILLSSLFVTNLISMDMQVSIPSPAAAQASDVDMADAIIQSAATLLGDVQALHGNEQNENLALREANRIRSAVSLASVDVRRGILRGVPAVQRAQELEDEFEDAMPLPGSLDQRLLQVYGKLKHNVALLYKRILERISTNVRDITTEAARGNLTRGDVAALQAQLDTARAMYLMLVEENANPGLFRGLLVNDEDARNLMVTIHEGIENLNLA